MSNSALKSNDIRADDKGPYPCPVCRKPLAVERVERGSKVLLYCPYGACESRAANLGGYGLTEREAFEAVCDACAVEEDEG